MPDACPVLLLQLTGYPPGPKQPADILWSQPYNRCDYPTSGGVVYALNDLSAGSSVTLLNEALYVFQSRLPNVIVVYKSAEDRDIPVACGVVQEWP